MKRLRSSRALSQSRCTVRSETSRNCAISLNEKPQKNFRSTHSASRASSLRQRLERLVQLLDLDRLPIFLQRVRQLGRQRGDLEVAAALLRMAAAQVVDDQPAHGARRVRHELPAIAERQRLAMGDVEEGFVQQRRRAQRDGGSPPQLALRHPMQLLVQHCEQAIARFHIAGARRMHDCHEPAFRHCLQPLSLLPGPVGGGRRRGCPFRRVSLPQTRGS